jgi:FdhD protein
MTTRATVTAITRLDAGRRRADADLVTVESPLRIEIGQPGRLEPVRLGVLMRTPGHDEALVVGLLVGEGLLERRDDLVGVSLETSASTGDMAHVEVAAGLDLETRLPPRTLTITSACGLCGRLEVQAANRRAPDAAASPISAEVLARLPRRLRAGQPVFDQTGGLHAAGLFAIDGEPLWLCEDIGRHNAVDKVLGLAWCAGRLPDPDLLLAVSGRVAFEIVQKAAMAGIGGIVAIGAPSSLAVDAARTAGLVLAGFARDDRANVYAGSARMR